MKAWYMLAPAIFIIVLVWLFQGERREQAKTVPGAVNAKEASAWSEPPHDLAHSRQAKTGSGAVDTREASAWSEPSHEMAYRREELAHRKNQLARVVEQQAHRPPPNRLATAVQPQPQAGTRNAREQASGDTAQARVKMNAQERESQERQRIEQIVSHLDDAFHSEPNDVGWAAQMETGLAKNFQADDWDGNALAEASCRSTLCRIVVAHGDLEAVDAFVARMGTLQAFANTEGFYQQVTLADGTSATVVYIARQGYQLPAMPSP